MAIPHMKGSNDINLTTGSPPPKCKDESIVTDRASGTKPKDRNNHLILPVLLKAIIKLQPALMKERTTA